ncbi:GntR family transcriptional regulator [Pseudarthrobacter sp. NamE2]|uniref:GntR family transcriptional regulator n=1 Tax=Pseudarthrobacter sp. NamE2 TaxID=2576838 RepID=UPI0010FEF47A|nr:GntR family transcriptional regulator [Pseudarthrobacter sp. NamE2]TLM83005.1 GntR family transcriptional regulator [Pseudarthrobacter sp. NamE2]
MSMNAALQATADSGQAPHAHTGAWVAGVLRSRISAGQLAPGSKLSEQKLSEALGVSRNTLREAFTVLAGESMVQRIPNRGVFVAAPGAEDVREIYRVRRLIEPAAVQSGEMPPGALEHLEAIVAKAQEAKAAGSVLDMADANQELHKALVGLSGSATLARLMEKVLAEMRLVFHAMSTAPDFHSHYVDLNAALVEQIRAGRRAEAAAELRRYLDAAERELLVHLGAVPAEPATKGGADR